VRSADARRAPEPGAGCPACRGRARGSMQLLPGAGRLLLLRGACIILLRGACICYSLHSIACPGPGCCEAASMSYPAASHAAAGPVRSVPAREAHRVGAHQAHAARGPGAGGQAARAGPGPGRATCRPRAARPVPPARPGPLAAQLPLRCAALRKPRRALLPADIPVLQARTEARALPRHTGRAAVVLPVPMAHACHLPALESALQGKPSPGQAPPAVRAPAATQARPSRRPRRRWRACGARCRSSWPSCAPWRPLRSRCSCCRRRWPACRVASCSSSSSRRRAGARAGTCGRGHVMS